jgi:hypothetical protein
MPVKMQLASFGLEHQDQDHPATTLRTRSGEERLQPRLNLHSPEVSRVLTLQTAVDCFSECETGFDALIAREVYV